MFWFLRDQPRLGQGAFALHSSIGDNPQKLSNELVCVGVKLTKFKQFVLVNERLLSFITDEGEIQEVNPPKTVAPPLQPQPQIEERHIR